MNPSTRSHTWCPLVARHSAARLCHPAAASHLVFCLHPPKSQRAKHVPNTPKHANSLTLSFFFSGKTIFSTTHAHPHTKNRPGRSKQGSLVPRSKATSYPVRAGLSRPRRRERPVRGTAGAGRAKARELRCSRSSGTEHVLRMPSRVKWVTPFSGHTTHLRNQTPETPLTQLHRVAACWRPPSRGCPPHASRRSCTAILSMCCTCPAV